MQCVMHGEMQYTPKKLHDFSNLCVRVGIKCVG